MVDMELDMNADDEEILERIYIVMSDYPDVLIICFKKSQKVVLKINK